MTTVSENGSFPISATHDVGERLPVLSFPTLGEDLEQLCSQLVLRNFPPALDTSPRGVLMLELYQV
jgi:hypothetical protein